MERAHQFETRRDINKIGKPVDHGEWEISAPTVDAYFNSQMNDINFPAGVLQPPLYDPKMDDAPNYGNTGGTIGHELTHGFDDEGSQFDAKGNLKDWWTKEDREKFDARTKCVDDQYSGYISVEDVHLNGKLTLGENVADLGGEILAYIAWKDANKDKHLQPIDGLTPEQRFFIGFAQWDCANERPEDLRMRAMTDPHSPARYRINGVVVNMPDYRGGILLQTRPTHGEAGCERVPGLVEGSAGKAEITARCCAPGSASEARRSRERGIEGSSGSHGSGPVRKARPLSGESRD